MQANIEVINDAKRKVQVEVPAQDVTATIERSYAKIRQNANLPGFRKGKAPLAMIKKHYQASMQEDAMRSMFESTLFKVLEENNLEPLDTPQIEEMSAVEENCPFTYTALVEIMPKVSVNDYKGLELKKARYVADMQAVDTEIERMRENMAQLVPVDGVIEPGMVVTTDYTFTVPDHPQEGNAGQDAQIETGKGNLLPGLEEGLSGMAVGETKTIEVTLTEGYGKPELAGTKAVFELTVKEIKKKELPELDDDFVQQFGEFETVDQMREQLAEMREQQLKEQIDRDLKSRAIDALVEKNPVEVPDVLVRRQADFMLQNLKSRLQSQNIALENLGFDEESFRTRSWPEATQKVKGGVLLMALIEQENIVVDDDDLEKRFQEIAGNDDALLERVRSFYTAQPNAKNSLIAEVKEDKAIGFLLEHAVITEVDFDELYPSEAKAQQEQA